MRYRVLSFALLFSLGAHLALFALSVWSGGGTAKAVKGELPVLSVRVPVAGQLKEVRVQTAPGLPDMPALTSDSKQIDRPTLQKKTEPDSMSPLPLILMADALDVQPQVIVEPAIEPDYGFADDVGGRVVLGLLINNIGSVVWVGIESSEVDRPTAEYLVRAFTVASFDVPTFRGRPVYALLRVEVDIPRKTTQSHRRGLH